MTPRRLVLPVGLALAAGLAATALLVPTADTYDESCAPSPSPALGDGASAGSARARVPIGFSPGFAILTDPIEEVRRDLDAMVELGVTRLRVDLSWAELQPEPDRFDWSDADRVLEEAQERGIDVLAVLGYEPDWAERTDEDGDRLPVDPTGFADFAAAAAERYADQVGAWEIWNEPNTARFWPTEPDPAAYAALAAAASPRIREADPEAPVLVGSMSPASDSDDELSPATFLSGIYDHLGLEHFDAVSVHPYSYPALATGEQSWNTFYRLGQLHEIMTVRGDGDTLIWLTEYGAPTGSGDRAVSEEAQADTLTVGIAEARRRCYTGPLYVYSLRDAGSDAEDLEDNFGVLREDGTPKPAYDALAAAVDAP